MTAHRLRRAVALAACAALAAPAAAHAGCGGVQDRPALRHLGHGPAPLMIGDSVLLGAMPEVARAGFQIDTRGCRGWYEGMAVLERRRHQHALPPEVVVQLGTNYSITRAGIRLALSIVGPHRALVLLTPREVFGEDGADAAAVRAAGRDYPTRILVLDWARYTAGRSSWFQPDGIHLTDRGARGLAAFLRRAAPFADGPPEYQDGIQPAERVAMPLPRAG